VAEGSVVDVNVDDDMVDNDGMELFLLQTEMMVPPLQPQHCF
jgi:hypothetical protein